MRSHKIIREACYDKGKKIIVIFESEIVNHYSISSRKLVTLLRKQEMFIDMIYSL